MKIDVETVNAILAAFEELMSEYDARREPEKATVVYEAMERIRAL